MAKLLRVSVQLQVMPQLVPVQVQVDQLLVEQGREEEEKTILIFLRNRLGSQCGGAYLQCMTPIVHFYCSGDFHLYTRGSLSLRSVDYQAYSTGLHLLELAYHVLLHINPT